MPSKQIEEFAPLAGTTPYLQGLRRARAWMEGKQCVVFTGAGISKGSGVPTYREKGGIWDKWNPMEVSSILYL